MGNFQRENNLKNETTKEEPNEISPTVTGLFEEMLMGAANRAGPQQNLAESFVGECEKIRHPTLNGRVFVSWGEGKDCRRAWLPTLHAISVRKCDRVLLQWPTNWPEPIVVGVIDGFAARPEVQPSVAATLEVQRDESVRVQAVDGTGLIEVRVAESGPVVRILSRDVDLEYPGALNITADQIALRAQRGQVQIDATDDVVVRGETIQLN